MEGILENFDEIFRKVKRRLEVKPAEIQGKNEKKQDFIEIRL